MMGPRESLTELIHRLGYESPSWLPLAVKLWVMQEVAPAVQAMESDLYELREVVKNLSVLVQERLKK